MINLISAKHARHIKTRYQRFNKWVDSIRDKRTGWASYKPEDVPQRIRKYKTSNDEVSKLEQFEFVKKRPKNYVLYVFPEKRIAGTWMGDKLGDLILGREYRTSTPFGRAASARVAVKIRGINGYWYYGTWYKSSGDYARVKRGDRILPKRLTLDNPIKGYRRVSGSTRRKIRSCRELMRRTRTRIRPGPLDLRTPRGLTGKKEPKQLRLPLKNQFGKLDDAALLFLLQYARKNQKKLGERAYKAARLFRKGLKAERKGNYGLAEFYKREGLRALYGYNPRRR